MSIRPATMSDAEALADLAGQLGYPSSADAVRRRMGFLIDDDNHELLVFEAEGRAVAWIGLVVTHSLTDDPHAELIGFVVGDGYRSAGIGRQLMGAAEDWARRKGCAKMSVRTNVMRADAHRFYERHGYALVKEQRVYRKAL